jgi:hypothetical protein
VAKALGDGDNSHGPKIVNCVRTLHVMRHWFQHVETNVLSADTLMNQASVVKKWACQLGD